jgi:GTP pyrophosphokinase
MILSTRFEQAMVYASVAHAGQVRKGSEVPYLSHLLAVTALVLEHGGTEDEAIAALLHDTVEDCGGTERGEDVRRRFGDAVADIVLGCSDTMETPKPEWRRRKENYLAHLPHAGPSVQLVSAADKLHNAQSLLASHRQIGAALWPRFSGGKTGTLWYYGRVTESYDRDQARLRPLVEELERVVAALQMRAAEDGYTGK